MTNDSKILSFIKKYSFATIITNKDSYPVATHLPFVVAEEGNKIKLLSHFAKANEHWKLITEKVSLVIFSEPHAYISPSNYEKTLNVPTWNYIAVHVYGKCKLITREEEVLNILEQTINTYETTYQTQWQSLPQEYKTGMMNGIVAFELIIEEIQAKEKLSQNKSTIEREKIIKSLEKSENSVENAIADYMKADLSL